MSDRERVRRPEPARTAPVRNVSGVFRSGDGAAAAGGPSDPAAGIGPDRHAPASAPFAWPGDDPVSRAVRAGCDVVETAMRRGFGLGRDPSSGPAWAGPWAAGMLRGPWAGQKTAGQWVDAMTEAFGQWAQWMDTWSSMVRSTMAGMGGSVEPGPGAWSGTPASPVTRSQAPSPSTVSAGAGALRLSVELRTARAVTVRLDLAPGDATALEVHGLLAPAAAAAPPITDVAVSVTDGGATVTLGSLEHHPAGTYAGAVLAAGRACGTLTVQLT